MSNPSIIENPHASELDSTSTFGGWVVTVFNNDHNTWDEVIQILILATGCDFEEAELETWEIDHLGRSVVHHGEKEECDDAAAVIAQIGIEVRVSKE